MPQMILMMLIMVLIIAPCKISTMLLLKFISPNADDDDAASPNSIILDYSIKRKIDPKSMLKQKKKVTEADADYPK